MTLATVHGNQISERICNALFNEMGIKAGRIPQGNHDVDFDWVITCEVHLSKSTLERTRSFIRGFVACWKAS